MGHICECCMKSSLCVCKYHQKEILSSYLQILGN
jgi:hypothetical protein